MSQKCRPCWKKRKEKKKEKRSQKVHKSLELKRGSSVVKLFRNRRKEKPRRNVTCVCVFLHWDISIKTWTICWIFWKQKMEGKHLIFESSASLFNFFEISWLDHHLRVVPEEVDTHLLTCPISFLPGRSPLGRPGGDQKATWQLFFGYYSIPKGRIRNKSVLDIFFSLRVCKYYLYTRTDVLRTTTTTARKIKKKAEGYF